MTHIFFPTYHLDFEKLQHILSVLRITRIKIRVCFNEAAIHVELGKLRSKINIY
jgi:hypothetical protein